LKLLSTAKVEVTSFAFGRNTMFLENHPQMPSWEQGRRMKDSFRLSDGKSLDLNLFKVNQVVMEMNGQDSRLIRDDQFLSEFSFGHVLCGEKVNCDLDYARDKKILTFEGVVFLSHIGSYNIHHFFLEVLPSLWEHKDFIRGKTLVVAGSSDSSFIQEIVELLDLELKIHIAPIGSICRFVDSFYVDFAPFRVYPLGTLAQIKHYLWNKLAIIELKQNTEKSSDFLFIGRGDASRNRRKILNEEKLLKFLENNFGEVMTIRPAFLKLEETIKLVGQAKVIAGPTGGALVHLIWARNIEKFIEIVPETYPGDTESHEFSRLFSFEHSFLSSRNVTPGVYFSSSDQEVIFP